MPSVVPTHSNRTDTRHGNTSSLRSKCDANGLSNQTTDRNDNGPHCTNNEGRRKWRAVPDLQSAYDKVRRHLQEDASADHSRDQEVDLVLLFSIAGRCGGGDGRSRPRARIRIIKAGSFIDGNIPSVNLDPKQGSIERESRKISGRSGIL